MNIQTIKNQGNIHAAPILTQAQFLCCRSSPGIFKYLWQARESVCRTVWSTAWLTVWCLCITSIEPWGLYKMSVWRTWSTPTMTPPPPPPPRIDDRSWYVIWNCKPLLMSFQNKRHLPGVLYDLFCTMIYCIFYTIIEDCICDTHVIISKCQIGDWFIWNFHAVSAVYVVYRCI